MEKIKLTTHFLPYEKHYTLCGLSIIESEEISIVRKIKKTTCKECINKFPVVDFKE